MSGRPVPQIGPVVRGQASTRETTGGGEPRSRLLGRIPRDHVGLVGALIVLMIAFTVASEFFLTAPNIANIARASAVIAIAASVTTVLLITGGIDLSIGAVLVLSGYALGVALDAGAHVVLAIGFALLVGAAVGVVNALIIVQVGVNPIIATIGTLFFFRGIVLLWSDGRSVKISSPMLRSLGSDSWIGIPIAVHLTAIFYVGLFFLLRFTRIGLHLYAIGGSENAARLSGIRVARLRWMTYIMSGLGAAAAGILLVGTAGAAIPSTSGGVELLIIAGVILGGTALGGGRGGVFGTLLGVAIFGVLRNGLTLVGAPAAWLLIVQGAALVGAITIDERRKRERETSEGRVGL